MVFEKKWYKSKTIWISLLTIIGGLATALADHMTAGGVITIMGVLNIFLRVITTEKIEF